MFAPGRWLIGLVLGAFVGAPVAGLLGETAGLALMFTFAFCFVALLALADTEQLR